MDWLVTSVLLSTHAAAFSVGTYVGRQGIELLRARLEAHEGVLVHKGAVPRMLYEPEMAEVRRRLDRLERRQAERSDPQ